MTAARGRVTALVAAVVAACVAFQLNASMLSPALVTMARELGTDEATVGLSQTMFFTLAAMFSLFLPRLSDIAGRRRVLLGMLAVMLLGSVIAALATGVGMLFAGRILQGVTGPVVPIGLLMLRSEITDPRRYGVALGLVTAVNGGVAGLDALAGGWLATAYGFRSIFWVIAVVTVAAIGCVAVWGTESRPSAGTRMDWRGVVPLVVAVGALLLAFDEAGALGDADWGLVALYVVVAVVAGAVFAALEARTVQPLVPVAFLRRRGTWATLATTLLTMTGVFAIANGLVASLAQNTTGAGFGLPADLTALVLLAPYALVGWLVGPFAGRLAPVLGYRTVLRIGLAGSVAATVLLAVAGVASLPVLVAGTLLLGITYAGIANIMLNGLGVLLSPPENPGMLPGLNAGAFNLGAGISFVVLPAAQIAFGGSDHSAAGYTGGMITGAVLTAAALGVSLLIPRPSAAETAPRETAVANGRPE
ncbi:uridine transporter UriT [Pseudonocardia phyllosphaerae]|uniref:uridine transporter UriT n=1 Tax=Pseudonocardia phyllosphaerae TaxID=3390502 RepID=UPI00397D325A